MLCKKIFYDRLGSNISTNCCHDQRLLAVESCFQQGDHLYVVILINFHNVTPFLKHVIVISGCLWPWFEWCWADKDMVVHKTVSSFSWNILNAILCALA